jgi:hypothetical protein
MAVLHEFLFKRGVVGVPGLERTLAVQVAVVVVGITIVGFL